MLVGPGLPAGPENDDFVGCLLAMFGAAALLPDASAMDKLLVRPRFEQPVLLTPHAGEMAHLSGRAKRDLVRPLLALESAIIYVLPDIKPVREFFHC